MEQAILEKRDAVRWNLQLASLHRVSLKAMRVDFDLCN